MKHIFLFIYLLYFTFPIKQCSAKTNQKKLIVDNLADIKDFKKILRTKTNVLVCFYNSYKQSQDVFKIFKEVGDNIKGEGTMVLVDCSGESKKMCKKLKIPNEPYTIKHYKDGDFNKDYDRKMTVISMTNFMRDPTGDIPWEEDASATDVVHISDSNMAIPSQYVPLGSLLQGSSDENETLSRLKKLAEEWLPKAGRTGYS